MNPILHIHENGDWYLSRPHATGTDIGPARYGEKAWDETADKMIAYYAPQGIEIRDARVKAAA